MKTVAELLDSPQKWCQGAVAMGRDNWPASSTSPRAVAWCLIGAVSRCYADQDHERRAALQRLKLAIYPVEDIARWNDTPGRGFVEVRKVIEEAQI